MKNYESAELEILYLNGDVITTSQTGAGEGESEGDGDLD